MSKPFYPARKQKVASSYKAFTPKAKNRSASINPFAPQIEYKGELVRLVLKSGSNVTLRAETMDSISEDMDGVPTTMICGTGGDGMLRAVPFNSIDYFEECPQ